MPNKCSSVLLPEPLCPTIARNSPCANTEAHAAQHRHFDRALAVALEQADRTELAGVHGFPGNIRRSAAVSAADGTSVRHRQSRPAAAERSPASVLRRCYSYRRASTGCSLAARFAGRMLAATAMIIAPTTIHVTVQGITMAGIL